MGQITGRQRRSRARRRSRAFFRGRSFGGQGSRGACWSGRSAPAGGDNPSSARRRHLPGGRGRRFLGGGRRLGGRWRCVFGSTRGTLGGGLLGGLRIGCGSRGGRARRGLFRGGRRRSGRSRRILGRDIRRPRQILSGFLSDWTILRRGCVSLFGLFRKRTCVGNVGVGRLLHQILLGRNGLRRLGLLGWLGLLGLLGRLGRLGGLGGLGGRLRKRRLFRLGGRRLRRFFGDRRDQIFLLCLELYTVRMRLLHARGRSRDPDSHRLAELETLCGADAQFAGQLINPDLLGHSGYLDELQITLQKAANVSGGESRSVTPSRPRQERCAGKRD